MNDVKEKLQERMDNSKIEKRKVYHGLDSYFIINIATRMIAGNQGIFGTQDSFHSTGPNTTAGDSVETPKIKNTSTPPLSKVHAEDFTARFVEMKAFFYERNFRT